MIRLSKLYARNFMCFESMEVDLLGRGMVGVLGENRDCSCNDNNGAGKSAILESIYFGLFGKMLRGGRMDDVVRIGASDGILVQITFLDVNNVEHTIERYHGDKREGGALYFRKGDGLGGSIDLRGEGKKETQDRINFVIGMSPQLFQHIVLFGQGGMPRFSELGDSAKKELIEEVLGVSVYKKAEKETRRRLSEALAEIDSKRMEVRLIEEQEGIALKRVGDSKSASESWERLQAERLQSIRDTMAKIEQSLEEMGVQREREAESQIKIWQDEENSIKIMLSEIDSRMEKIDKAYRIKKDELLEQRSKVQGELSYWQQKRDKLDVMAFKGLCPECERPFRGGEYDFSEIDKNLSTASERRTELVNELAYLECAYKEIAKEESSRTKLLEGQLEEKSKEILSLTQHTHIEKARRVMLDDSYENLRRDFEKESRAKNSHAEKLKEAQEALFLVSGRLLEARNRIDYLTLLRHKLEVLVKVFGPSGIRSFVFESLLGELNNRIDDYTTKVTDGVLTAILKAESETASGEMREKIMLEVVNLAGGPTYQLSSGGERRRLDLPISFALQDVAARRGIGLGICLLDEVFESLDETGITRVVGLLNYVSARVYTSTIFVITHDEDLKVWFPVAVRVIKEGGKSKIEEVT